MRKYRLNRAKYSYLLGLLCLFGQVDLGRAQSEEPEIIVGAERAGAYLPLLYQKKVGVIANHTSLVKEQHLVDYLLDNKVAVKRIFAPEHGFRGVASAGEQVEDGKDPTTGLPVISLYGNEKKPRAGDLQDLDVLLFDIQDVGARFYTYISTMSLAMEAAAENGLEFIVLDRPNPNGSYVDGPVLEMEHKSFVGLHPVPVIHGMTVGEYAQMVNGEGWLRAGIQVDLSVVKCQNYHHQRTYQLPVAPSPNLPNHHSVVLYPSLCLFEGTPVSVGRGTDKPFQVVGAPWFSDSAMSFVPRTRPGAKNPKHQGERCYGFDLSTFAEYYLDGLGELYLFWLIEAYKMAPDKEHFFNDYFTLLAGTEELEEQIKKNWPVGEIRASWEPELSRYKLIRQKYLLYEK